MFGTFSVKKYLKVIQANLESKESHLIESFRSLNNLEFPEDARVLIAVSSMDDLHDEAQIVLSLPIYFRFTDEEDALNLVTGEW